MATAIWKRTAFYIVPKRLDFEMLFWALDEEFDHLSFLVKICNFKGCKLLGFGEKSELMFFSSS